MGLQENLQNIQTNLLSAKTAIAQSISNKGVECSADEALSTYATKIDSISGGGTGSTGNKIMLTDGTKFGYSNAFDPELYDVSNVINMSNMFYRCSGLTGELDLSSWNVSNVTDMSNMFYRCLKLTNINVSTWNVSNVTNMGSMFANCDGLTGELDLSSWDVSNVTNMGNMFSYCLGLTSLDLSTWNLGNVYISLPTMFSNCKSLTNLQLNDLGHHQSCTSLDLSDCSALTKDSILFLFNNAFDRATAGYTTAFTITLNATTKALLSEDEIAIATNKGFTVV